MLGWLFGKKGGGAPAGESETRELFTVSRTVSGPVDRAFAVFADRTGDWWPRDYSWAKDNLDTMVIEARMRGRCFERSKDGAVAIWGTVLACSRPEHLVIAWQIRPDRSPEPEEGMASRVDIRFVGRDGKTDVVLFVFREEYYHQMRKPTESNREKFAEWQAEGDRVQGKAEVIIGKQRHGPTGTVELQFDAEVTRFANLDAAHRSGF